MVGRRLKDGGEVEDGHAKGGEVVQLFDHAPEVSAKEDVVFEGIAVLFCKLRDAVFPIGIEHGVGAQLGVSITAAEAIDEDMVHRAAPEPVRGMEVLLVDEETEFRIGVIGEGEIDVIDAV